MCFGGKSSTNTAPPAPQQPTTFDYSVANRGQADANRMIGQLQQGKVLSSTSQQTFGSELGSAAPATSGGM